MRSSSPTCNRTWTTHTVIKEYQLVDSRLISDHEYAGDLSCTICAQPRWNHRLDGFRPSTLPSIYPQDRSVSYRGPHPAWARPGSFSTLERAELEAEKRAERRRIEQAIRADKERFARMKQTL